MVTMFGPLKSTFSLMQDALWMAGIREMSPFSDLQLNIYINKKIKTTQKKALTYYSHLASPTLGHLGKKKNVVQFIFMAFRGWALAWWCHNRSIWQHNVDRLIGFLNRLLGMKMTFKSISNWSFQAALKFEPIKTLWIDFLNATLATRLCF